ncbi:Retrovirus-related Pol polyprotein from transposon gypsy [Thelohanellus kitauei]|uniref:Retrovirus-related Pol polyprotein from transposon gypsy n=1 Tax=Thelohanellus kitauei TaxID=669202 RepID=A0A0C2MGM2_THEKT|nr:Retrovirus-related Pol polyprotein from transposon gypsy [Thelohanellus kitauei]
MDASSGVSSGIEEIRPEFLTKAYDVNKWLFLFEELAVANKWNEARQAAVLPVFLRDDALEAYMESPLHTESPSPSKLKKLKTLLRNFRTTNDTISSAFVRFENARLAPGEDIKDFAKKLSQSIRTARPNLSEEDRNFFVLQKLLASLPKQTSSILRVLPDLKLDDTINKARQLMMDDESTNSVASIEPTNEKEVPNRHDDIEALRAELDELKTVCGLRDKEKFECTKCGLRGHRSQECRGTALCYVCNARGHISRICPRNKNSRTFNYTNKSYRRYYIVSGISSTRDFNFPLCLIDLKKTVSCLIDTGASVSLIRSDYVDPCLIKKANANIVGVDGSSLNIIGEVDLRICLGSLTTMWRFIVVKNLIFEAIIGRDIMLCYGAQINFTQEYPLSFKKVPSQIASANSSSLELTLCREFEHAISKNEGDLGKTNSVQHHIKVFEDRQITTKPYRTSIHQSEEIDRQIHQMMENSIIRPSDSPHCSPTVLVKKKSGGFRFCIDFRKLNDITVKDQYPLPLIDTIFDRLNGSHCFSTIDLKSALIRENILHSRQVLALDYLNSMLCRSVCATPQPHSKD